MSRANKLTIILLYISCSFCLAQSTTEIRGRAVDLEGAGLPMLNILVKEKSRPATIAYSVADTAGYFHISFRSLSDSILVKFTGLSIADTMLLLANQSRYIELQLDYRNRPLKELKIKGNLPIRQMGDTLRYDVSRFEKPVDRSIGDVISRMPGLSISTDGTIEYQGEPIEKFYIDGLDLLEGRYALAHRNLPSRSVLSVDVLENHQPVKVLDSLVYSDRTSLNIRLAAGVTTTGQTEATAGGSEDEVIWQANITPMLFTGETQMLASLQTNNIGDQLNDQRRVFTRETIQENDLPPPDQNRWLGIQQLSQPAFGKERVLFNNSHLGSVNILRKLGNHYQLKAYVSLYNHQDRALGNSSDVYFLPDDTLQIDEQVTNKYRQRQLESKLTVEKNDKKSFLRNTLKFQAYDDAQVGQTSLSGQLIQEQVSLPFYAISNQFTWLRPTGKRLVTYRSLIDFQQSNQTLYVQPTLFGSPATEPANAKQHLAEGRAHVRHSASYGYDIGKIRWSGELGFGYQRQRLTTRLEEGLAREHTEALPLFANDLLRQQYKLYHDVQLSYEQIQWKIKVGLPVNYQWASAVDSAQGANLSSQRLFFNPSLRVNYQISPLWKSMFSLQRKEGFPLNENLHFGAILRNYRQVQNLSSVIPRYRSHNVLGSLGYRNPVNSFFFNMRYQYRHQWNNTVIRNHVTPDGLQTRFLANEDNVGSYQEIAAKISKFVSSWNTTFRLGSRWQETNTRQFINDRPSEVINRSLAIIPGIDVTIFRWMDIEYLGTLQQASGIVNGQRTGHINQISQRLAVYLSPTSQHLLRFSADDYLNETKSSSVRQTFVNFLYRYTLAKKQIDFSVRIENLLNERTFVDYQADSFTVLQDIYRLRPRQFLLSATFVF